MTTTRISNLNAEPAGIVLARADLAFLLADLLRRPSEYMSPRLAETLESLEELVREAAFDAPHPLQAALASALVQAGEVDLRSWSDEYHRLFEGAMVCPPNETAYIRRDKGAIIADACGFYRAFGFRAEAGEKPDHLLTQLEFIGALLAMLATTNDQEWRDVVTAALVDFADSHLGEWLGIFAGRLEAASPLPLYVASAQALRELWGQLSAAHGLRVSSSSLAGEPEAEDDEPLECGLAEPGGPVG